MDEDESSIFVLGFLAGILFVFVCLFIISAIVLDRPSDVQDIQPPKSVYLVTVDDVEFTCDTKPDVSTHKIKLWGCKELFGDVTLIQSYNSYSIEEMSK